MPRRTLRRILRADTIAVEGWMSLMALACGAFIMLPFPATSPPFEALSRAAPEWTYGALLFGCGIFQFYTVKAPRRSLKIFAALFCGACWVSITAATILSDARSLASVVYAVMALVQFWLLLRAPTGAATGGKGAK